MQQSASQCKDNRYKFSRNGTLMSITNQNYQRFYFTSFPTLDLAYRWWHYYHQFFSWQVYLVIKCTCLTDFSNVHLVSFMVAVEAYRTGQSTLVNKKTASKADTWYRKGNNRPRA